MVGAGPLGELVLVVGEDQVVAAAVDVHRQAEVGLDHGRALDVPAGAARAPGTVPHRLARLGRLPQHEVGRVLLVGSDLDPGAGDHVVQGAARQLAVVGEGGGVEQHVALGRIGAALGCEAADLVEHGGDVGGGVRLDRGGQHAEGRHVLAVDGGEAVGDGRDGGVLLDRRLVYPVVHVGDVAGVDHRRLAVEAAQHPEQHVEHHRRAGVADVGVGIDRRPADVERHPARVAGLERPLLAGVGVVQDQHGAGL